jgi:SSS family solute:Na+ symporter
MADFVVVGAYLLTIVGVGFWASRGQSSLEDYAVAGRRFGPVVIFATMSASFIGGGFSTGNAANVFLLGVAGVVGLWGFSVKEILVATLIAPKMDRFRSAISVGDVMAVAYGRTGRLVTGVSGLMLCTALVGAQVGAMGIAFNVFYGIDRLTGIAVGCGIVILYTTLGGMRAVVASDIIQFVILSLGMPLVLVFGVAYVGGVDALLAAVPAGHVSIPGEHYTWAGLIALMFTFLLGETLVPFYFQRLLSGKSAGKTARGTLWCGLFSIPFFAITGLIGLVALAIDPSLNSNLALPHVVTTVMPPVLKGFVIAAVLSIVMSSADSVLNSASIAFTNDILGPLQLRPLSDWQALWLARGVTLSVGLLSVAFALTIDAIIDILIYAYTYWAPVVLVPLVATIYGHHRSLAAFVSGALAGAVVAVVWDHVLGQPAQVTGLVVGVLANLIVFFAVPARGTVTAAQT